MTDIIKIYDKEKLVRQVTVNEMSGILGGRDGHFDNELMQRDFDNMTEYLRGQSVSPDETAVDISQLLSGSQLDAQKTNAIFWLTAVLMEDDVLKRLSSATAMKLLPHIAAKTKAAELRCKADERDSDAMLEFLVTYRSCTRKLAADECGIDEAVQQIYDVLPPERTARNAVAEQPKAADVFRSAQQLGDMCSEPDLRQKIQDYFDKISDILL